MSINAINLSKPQKYSLNNNPQPQIKSVQPQFTSNETSQKVKTVSAITSLIGSGTVLAMIAKKQGFPISPKNLKNIPMTDWAIFKIGKRGIKNQKLLEIEEKEILALASGSVAGGLAGGAMVDKKNMKAKGREALTQLLGNVVTPVAFVGVTSRLYKKYEKPLKSIMPTVKTNGKKSLKMLNKLSRSIPAITLTGVALGTGILAGSKVTNFINEKFFGQKKEREIKSSDFAPHVDDLCLAITLMGSKTAPLPTAITRTVPLFLSVPGYQVGKAQEVSEKA